MYELARTLKVPNHGRLFKALIAAHVPNWPAMDMVRKAGRKPLSDGDRTSAHLGVNV